MITAVLGLVALAVPARFVGAHCFSVRSQPTGRSAEVSRVTGDVKGYARSASSTYLTLPEWYIVYSTEEYASFVRSRAPSRFPHFAAVRQYWRYYKEACRVTKRVYPFDAGAHLMLGVIGLSFSIENAVKGGYENTIGVVTEGIGFYHTEEDVFARKTAREYAAFMHTVPWYEFPFAGKLKALWTETPLWGLDVVRKWERRFALSAEYALKAAYAGLIRWGTGAVYRPEDLVIHAWIDDASDRIFADGRIRMIKAVTPGSYIVTIPRYEAFTQIVVALARQGVRFRDFAGNDAILLTAIAPQGWDERLRAGELLFSETLLTNPGAKRIGVKVPVTSLHAILAELPRRGVTIEHLYDY